MNSARGLAIVVLTIISFRGSATAQTQSLKLDLVIPNTQLVVAEPIQAIVSLQNIGSETIKLPSGFGGNIRWAWTSYFVWGRQIG